QGLRLLRELRADIEHSQVPEDARAQALFLLGIKESDFVNAISLAGGVRLDTLADRSEAVPGESFTVTITGTVHAPGDLKAGDVSLKGPPGWKVERLPPPAAQTPSPGAAEAETVQARFRVAVPPEAPISQPYWLVKTRTRDYFPAPNVPWVGAAENPALF